MVMQEHAAIQGATTALGGEEVLAVALAFPPGTTKVQGEALIVGDLLGGIAGGSSGVGAGGGIGMLGSTLALREGESAPSYVLAVTATAVHVLGRPKVGPFGGWHHLSPLTSIDRSSLSVSHKQNGVVQDLTLTDTTTGHTVDVELKPIANGLGTFLAALGQETPSS